MDPYHCWYERHMIDSIITLTAFIFTNVFGVIGIYWWYYVRLGATKVSSNEFTIYTDRNTMADVVTVAHVNQQWAVLRKCKPSVDLNYDTRDEAEKVAETLLRSKPW